MQTTDAECPKRAAVLANRPLLVTLLRNLILNAAAASPANGPIAVRCTEAGGGWEIAVTDTGQGIPAEEREKIFEPFYRIDKSRSRQSGGSGLGLSICLAIAKAHGGTLCIESEAGKGTTARLTLKGAAE